LQRSNCGESPDVRPFLKSISERKAASVGCSIKSGLSGIGQIRTFANARSYGWNGREAAAINLTRKSMFL
jgi:hypothetical protein